MIAEINTEGNSHIYGNIFPTCPTCIIKYYYTSLSFFLYKSMTVVLLLHPKINCLTIFRMVPVKNCRTIPLCGNFSNNISHKCTPTYTAWIISQMHTKKINIQATGSMSQSSVNYI
jgi:hypothetical protein